MELSHSRCNQVHTHAASHTSGQNFEKSLTRRAKKSPSQRPYRRAMNDTGLLTNNDNLYDSLNDSNSGISQIVFSGRASPRSWSILQNRFLRFKAGE
ncbi:hypothetical protein PSP6_470061 [Paraburkholderia tropica]|nr:hypothetical protein PSP6_470061 [Paraburkholderia tropica]